MSDLAGAPGSRGEAAVRHFLSIWNGEGGNPGMTIHLRSALPLGHLCNLWRIGG